MYARLCSVRHFLTGSSLQSSSEDRSQQTIGETLQARDFSDKISYAFQLATAQGPLCNEPVQGVAVFLEEVTIHNSSDDEVSARDKLGRLTGEVIKTVQSSIKQGFLDWSPRLLLAMYSCEIQASSKFSFHPPFVFMNYLTLSLQLKFWVVSMMC
jgi:ribosome assembly protein 1